MGKKFLIFLGIFAAYHDGWSAALSKPSAYVPNGKQNINQPKNIRGFDHIFNQFTQPVLQRHLDEYAQDSKNVGLGSQHLDKVGQYRHAGGWADRILKWFSGSSFNDKRDRPHTLVRTYYKYLDPLWDGIKSTFSLDLDVGFHWDWHLSVTGFRFDLINSMYYSNLLNKKESKIIINRIKEYCENKDFSVKLNKISIKSLYLFPVTFFCTTINHFFLPEYQGNWRQEMEDADGLWKLLVIPRAALNLFVAKENSYYDIKKPRNAIYVLTDALCYTEKNGENKANFLTRIGFIKSKKNDGKYFFDDASFKVVLTESNGKYRLRYGNEEDLNQ